MEKTLNTPTEKTMRAAVKARDKRLDGQFVFAVITTGIYCRPSCPSRPAKAENMRFFNDTNAATDAGFRACKRCHPDKTNETFDNLVTAARYLEERAEEKITLKDLAAVSGLSVSQLQRKFKSAFGVTPKAYQDQYRLEKFKSSLKSGDPVTEAIYSSGFGSPSRVYGEAMRNIGMTPGAYRAGGAGEIISYAHRTTDLGDLLMAATDRGVCFAQFGDSPKVLTSQLHEEFPNAEITPSTAGLGKEIDSWIAALNDYLQAQAPRPDLPLDLRGTAFQIKVWKFLLSSKEGDVYSYAELAKGIDKPKATRAAASACGANRIAILVPCHRVLRGDGSIGGYRWGVERKRSLLDIERAKKNRRQQ